MGVEYCLVNQTKKEVISFAHLNGAKKRELAGNAAQSAIVTWYLLENQGDYIQFVSDTYDDWPFDSGTRECMATYSDKTHELITALIEQQVLKDNGLLFEDEDDKTIYIRDIQNNWQVD